MARSSRMAGGCSRADGGEAARRGQARRDDGDLARTPRPSSAMCTASCSPHRPSSVRVPVGQLLRGEAPASRVTTTRGQRHVAVGADCAGDHVGQPSPSAYPSSLATFWNQATSGRRQIDAGDEHQRRDARTSARRTPWPRRVGAARLAEGDVAQAAGTARRRRPAGRTTSGDGEPAARARRSS